MGKVAVKSQEKSKGEFVGGPVGEEKIKGNECVVGPATSEEKSCEMPGVPALQAATGSG